MTTPYQPPTRAAMQAHQNSDSALQLLVAQRSIYSTAKRYLAARLMGMFLIATAAPIVGGFWPSLAVICGAVAGAWLFVGRTYLTSRQIVEIDRAAAVQERFDVGVFGMPLVRGRENMPSLEDIAKVSGRMPEVKRQARVEKLRDWYPLEPAANAVTAVAICQRANVSYSDALLRKTAKIWRAATVAWFVVAIIVSILVNASFENILLILVLPILPAFLDVVEFSRSYDTASHIRRTTANEIEQAVTPGGTIEPSQLLVWQERIYELRRTTPLVPDVIYWAQRKANERAMKTAATQLASKSQK